MPACIIQAKAISKDTIDHTPQGTGPSRWFLVAKPGVRLVCCR